MPTRIVLVDGNTLFRQGLRALFTAQNDFRVMADVADGALGYNAVVRFEPELVITDITLRGQSALEFVPMIKRRMPGLRVLVLTSHRSEEHLRDALLVGAEGFVLKDAPFAELLNAISSIFAGRKYISPEASAYLVAGFLNPQAAAARASPLSGLTNRERSILQLIAEGRSNRTAAEVLQVSSKTVEKHRANLMRKLGLRNSAELLLAAIEMGLIERPGTVSRLVAGREAAAT
jgi:DNA-binding NarL/FixJ family response regulator